MKDNLHLSKSIILYFLFKSSPSTKRKPSEKKDRKYVLKKETRTSDSCSRRTNITRGNASVYVKSQQLGKYSKVCGVVFRGCSFNFRGKTK